jgi:hypothetical protein
VPLLAEAAPPATPYQAASAGADEAL